METQKPSTHQKALELNMDPCVYGTIAEIGAGQEVARWFFRVGGAAGTVAKTISAYDMTFSDAIYGPSHRYVSRERLRVMLEYEYALIEERLDAKRGESTRFFAYAATVATRSYSRQTDGHGWIGVRLQQNPRTPPSDILLHVRLFEEDSIQQHEALGILGVNLLWAVSKYGTDSESIVSSLMDELSRRSVEIDVVLFQGPDFETIDNRLVTLSLVEKKLTSVVFFSPEGKVQHGSELLYKRSVLIERGKFAPVTTVNLEMLEVAREVFSETLLEADGEILEVMEITMHNLLGRDGINHDDFLARLEILKSLGITVMVSEYGEFYRLAAHLNRYTNCSIGFVMGVSLLREIFKEKYYSELPGGILESFGRLFKSNVRLLTFPAIHETTGELLTSYNLQVEKHLEHLLAHLRTNKVILSLPTTNPKPLSLTSAFLADDIRKGDPSWKSRVTPEVAKIIEERGYWGCKPSE